MIHVVIEHGLVHYLFINSETAADTSTPGQSSNKLVKNCLS